MDARIKSGHDRWVLWGEANELRTHTNFTIFKQQNKSRRDVAPRGAMRPRFAFISRPIEGVGNAGCPLHPQPRVHFVLVERTRVTTSTPESPGIPARNGFNGLLRALPGDRAFLPPSSADVFCLSPVWPTQLRELDTSVGASGPHDFAVRGCISRPLAW